jgi:hypothetical protein
MHRRQPQLDNGRLVRRRAVALMHPRTRTRGVPPPLPHQLIPRLLGDDRRRRDRSGRPVSALHPLMRQLDALEREPVDQVDRAGYRYRLKRAAKRARTLDICNPSRSISSTGMTTTAATTATSSTTGKRAARCRGVSFLESFSFRFASRAGGGDADRIGVWNRARDTQTTWRWTAPTGSPASLTSRTRAQQWNQRADLASDIRANSGSGVRPGCPAGVAGFEPATYGFGDRRSTN